MKVFVGKFAFDVSAWRCVRSSIEKVRETKRDRERNRREKEGEGVGVGGGVRERENDVMGSRSGSREQSTGTKV